MAIIYSYPLSTPKVADLLIGTSTFDENAATPVYGNPTVSFTISALIGMIATSTGAQNLQQVTNIGAITTNVVTFSNDIKVTGKYYDSGGNPGTVGQRLSSTGTGTSWLTDTGSGVTSIAAYNTVLVADRRYVGLVPTATTTGAVQIGLDITGMTDIGAFVTGPDIMVVTDDVAGFPYNKKITVANLKTFINDGTVTSLTTTGTSGVSTLVTGVLNIPNYTYALPLAADGTRGGVQIGYVQNAKNYPIELSSEKMFVNVPWTDTGIGPGTQWTLPVWATTTTLGDSIVSQNSTVTCYVTGTGAGTIPDLEVRNTGDSNYGARITLQHESASPANNDIVGIINFNGRDSALGVETFASIYAYATNVSSTGEEGILGFNTRTNTSQASNTQKMKISNDGAIKFNLYGQNTFTGTAAYNLSVNASGDIIETANPSTIIGPGTQWDLPVWATTTTLGDSMISQNAGGTELTVEGKLSVIDSTDPANLVEITVDDPTIGGSTTAGFLNINGGTAKLYIGQSGGGHFGLFAGDAAYIYNNNTVSASKLAIGNITNTDLILGTNNAANLTVQAGGMVQLNTYGSGTKTGTAVYNLSVAANGEIIETPASQTGASLVYTQAYTAANLFTGGTQTFNVTGGVPVGKQLLIENLVYYLDYGGTSFDYINTDEIKINYSDGWSTVIGPKISNVDTFMNTTKDAMTEGIFAFSGSIFPHLLGEVVVGASPGFFDLVLPTARPTVGNGTLYVSMQYKLLDTGTSFSL